MKFQDLKAPILFLPVGLIVFALLGEGCNRDVLLTGSSGKPKAGEIQSVYVSGGVMLDMVWIPPGNYMMGGSQSEEETARIDDTSDAFIRVERPQHMVVLEKGFWLGKHEVTQEQWSAVMGDNPSCFKATKNPVERVSWDECQKFVYKLNSRVPGGGFRLPSEAEWEYACRAGTTTPYHFGETATSDQMNFDGTRPYGGGAMGVHRDTTTPVGIFPANAWGLHDMHGNVAEWCEDDWHEEYHFSPRNGDAWVDTPRGKERVYRGGSWGNCVDWCRSAYRNSTAPYEERNGIGLRLVREAAAVAAP